MQVFSVLSLFCSCFWLLCSQHNEGQKNALASLSFLNKYSPRCRWFGSGWPNRLSILSSTIVSSFLVFLHRLGGCVNLPTLLNLCLYTLSAHEISTIPQGILDWTSYSDANHFFMCVCDSHGTHLHSGKFNTSFSENNIASDSAITHRAAGLQQQLEYKIHIFRITSCHSHIAGLALFTLDSKRKKCLTLWWRFYAFLFISKKHLICDEIYISTINKKLESDISIGGQMVRHQARKR